MIEDGFSWKKFFSGLVNPLNFAKALVMMIYFGIIVIIIFSVSFAVVMIKNKFIKPKKITPSVSISENFGAVHSSTDEHRKKLGLINIF